MWREGVSVSFPTVSIRHRALRQRVRENFVLFVGALQARKNVKRLVEAFESLPDPWRLVLAGAHGGYRANEIFDRIGRAVRGADRSNWLCFPRAPR